VRASSEERARPDGRCAGQSCINTKWECHHLCKTWKDEEEKRRVVGAQRDVVEVENGNEASGARLRIASLCLGVQANKIQMVDEALSNPYTYLNTLF